LAVAASDRYRHPVPADPLFATPADFRLQAATYHRFRRDYSGALYDTVESRTAAPAGRRALDLGSGTGFVTASLARRGWRVAGGDFSAPMLAEARRANPEGRFVRMRSEALALADESVSLVTSGTAFHWFERERALEEMTRVLVPGGWVAVFWRYAVPDDQTVAVMLELLGELGFGLPSSSPFSPEPFAGSRLESEPEIVLESTLDFSPDDFHGYVSTIEWLRRVTGDQHGRFLERLLDQVKQRWPDGVRERNAEHLFLARKPG
jgi:SAM-dependent methyltransferase